MTQQVKQKPLWTSYDACACVEGFDNIQHDEDVVISAWQYLLDEGLVWELQGWYGRAARDLIDAGLIFLK